MAEFSVRFDSGTLPLRHHWRHCVGSGHATLALRADWREQLARCRRELGVEHVRFHGILDDDMGTLVSVQDQPCYSFFNADSIMHFLDSTGMAPLVELSFMPRALASGDRTVFSYAGNVTPPRDPSRWSELIARLAGHWHRAFGRDCVLRWLFEVWNEPNLEDFWTGGQQAYFDLYARTAQALKQVSPELRVGGPATAKGEWLPEFLAFCERRGVPCDFVSTHSYPTDALGSQSSDTVDQLASSSRHAMRELALRVRAQASGRPLFLTEWSITSNPRDPMHDEPIAAAYAIKAALEMAGTIDGSSWWTFSDLFEENYFPSQPFHGGFGLLTIHGIPKPSYRAFQLLNRLGERSLPVLGEHPTVDCWAVRGAARLDLVLTQLVLPRHPATSETVKLRVRGSSRPHHVSLRRIDHDHANPRRMWTDLGQPEHLDNSQLARLHDASAMAEEEVAWTWHGEAEGFELSLTLPINGVAMITCEFADDGSLKAEVPEIQATAPGSSDEARLRALQAQSYGFFLHHTDPRTGLARDRSAVDSPLSIAATGMALACYPTAVERGFITHGEALQLASAALRFLLDAPHGPQQDATGYQGFYYHFLEPVSGRRTWKCELSTVDTALLIAGALTSARYFTGDAAVERGIRDMAGELAARADWRWALDGGETVCHGWHPERGFIPQRWEGYSEALMLYALALGSTTHGLGPEHYAAWTRSYVWRSAYGIDYLYAGPLFIHQLSHCWIDFRGIRDEPMRARDCDYFENSRRATTVQSRYAADNPLGFRGYAADSWGMTACEGPGPSVALVDGVERTFFGYRARGAPFGPDDGTLAPWAAITSLPFAPDLVVPTIRRYDALQLRHRAAHGFPTTFNPTYPDGPAGWTSTWHYGLNQGPIVLMIDNHLDGLPWRLMRGSPEIVRGLRRAGFTGGWLDPCVES